MMKPHALIIDDEPDIRELLAITLERMQIDCDQAETLAAARDLLKTSSYQLCLTDMRLPDGDGINFVGYLQKHQPQMPVAVITAHGNMECAIAALKAGAFDFLTKPVDLKLLRALVESALRLSEQDQPAAVLSATRQLIGASTEIRTVIATIAKLARSQAPVYISGESGTGKELVARLIHEQGSRAGQPFVPVNCGAIPQDLMESEFFGHKKGSFTGASSDKDGLFQAAHGGTLFLDEIAELPQHMQVKLLRAIQEKCVRPVGAQHEVEIDVRILSATHKNLAEQVANGGFRQDLFYRVNVIELHVPPLRDRSDDIPLLVEHILRRLLGPNSVLPTLAPAALEGLKNYAFPGNVRELENILERALTLYEGEQIQLQDLRLPGANADPRAGVAEMPLDNYLVDIEKQSIIEALEKTRWNKTAAAKLLGISFRALRYRMEKLNLE
ncbi:MAG: sigma-54 dependent transcriptional regulator [Gammaproteobacteria bacterium]